MPPSAVARLPFTRLLIAAALAVCSAASVRAQTPAAAQADTAVPAAARALIDSANAEWLPALQRKDAAAIAARYADDGVVIMGNGTSVRGREAIEQVLAESASRLPRILSGALVQDGITRSGDLLYEWGRGELELQPTSGAPARIVARYLTVWKAGADGRWRIIRNMTLP